MKTRPLPGHLAAALTLFSLLSTGSPAVAFTINSDNGEKITWKQNTIAWYLHPSGSQDMPFEEFKGAIQAAFNTWDNLPCFSKSFSFGGTKSSDPQDGIYVMVKESNWDPTVGDAAAYSQNWTDWSGNISHNVIVFNGVDLTWTTTEAMDYFSEKTDVQGVGTHELGHSIGLDHSRWRAATMFFSGSSAELRTLDQDDKDGVCYLYSAFTSGKPCDSCTSNTNCSGAPCLNVGGLGFCGKNCSSDANCPETFTCEQLNNGSYSCYPFNNNCAQQGANIPMGQYCYGHETCKSGLVCLVLPDTAYCSKECTSNAQCGSLKCVSGLCMQGGNTPLGGSCQMHPDCESGLCLGISENEGVCTSQCKDTVNCPNGFLCAGGYCMKAGDGKYGTACTKDIDCQTGQCLSIGGLDKICSKSCTTKGDCPGSNPCTFSVCIPPGSGLFGATCAKHTDCASGFCAGMSMKQCSIACKTDADCPAGAGCVSGGYCVKKKPPTGSCNSKADCKPGEFCRQASADVMGMCTPECNPFGDTGCADGSVCQWVYQPFEDVVHGECVPSNDGGDEGALCLAPNPPCIQDLVCMNVGGTGAKCYRDCNSATGFGCGGDHSCLALNLSSDPYHGVCVCGAPSCMEVPDEDVTGPDDDVTEEPEPPTPGKDVKAGKDTSGSTPNPPVGVEPGTGGGGCSLAGRTPTGASPLVPILLLAAALYALVVTRRRRV
ncbi:MAG: matrixin family metalloprotease [Deltaproteobacteria bacterium]|nr:matrixin family metalloprotease [Deltaproteobacteria bacterium]